MTTTSAPTTGNRQSSGSAVQRVLALGRAETIMLIRNRTALFNSILLPIALVIVMWQLLPAEALDVLGDSIVPTMIGITLLFVTYYNLVTTFVARREEAVLKRMRTGELKDGEIVLGTAVPTILVSIGQIVLLSVGVGLIDGFTVPTNIVLLLIAVIGGVASMVLLAAASTSFTRTAETAQVTTLPLMLAGTGLSGLFFPLSVLPDTIETIARLTPVAPVIELARLGMSGVDRFGDVIGFQDTFSAAVSPAVVLLAWVVIGALLTRQYFRWEPRR